VASSKVRILKLPLSFFVENSDLIEGMDSAMLAADEWMEEQGIPEYDFKLFYETE
jgi:hypothetical protein